jgi:hypothetical protein
MKELGLIAARNGGSGAGEIQRPVTFRDWVDCPQVVPDVRQRTGSDYGQLCGDGPTCERADPVFKA